MSVNSPMDQEAAAKAAAAAASAFQQFVTEDFTLFAVGLTVTAIRTLARVKQVGFKGLQGDDYLVWLAMLIYAAETALAYSVGAVAMGLANNGMTVAERRNLDPNGAEYHTRVTGCKIQISGWSTYSALLWTLKASLLVFYIRLTSGLGQTYRRRIYIGFALLGTTYLAATLNLFLGCRPFHKYWQINPDPGDGCQPAVSTRIVWVYASLNILSDLYLLSIPIPMLWNTTLALPKKIGLIILFSGGVFIIVCALIRAVLIVTDPIGGAQTAGSWAVRETFVAVITTNLPMAFPLVSGWLKPIFSSLARSMRSGSYEKSTDGKFRRSIATFGGGARDGQNKQGRAPRTANPLTGLTFTESEERMLSQGQVKLQDLTAANPSQSPIPNTQSDENSDGIRKDIEIAVTSVPGDEQRQPPQSFAFATGPMRKSPSTRLPK
ncbi:putative triacylglycerol lipase-like protein [Rosellinia necatrix]|uniref:Putative triacylglycerol lipase-like protein n=1 Tax=Rosellinia necatrix TaxID=77044 RepID=A0A1W2TWC2_ROSNE|nr:putative triacylglycerol lipase-like protein [Rosellinia necatrix]